MEKLHIGFRVLPLGFGDPHLVERAADEPGAAVPRVFDNEGGASSLDLEEEAGGGDAPA